MYYDTTLLLGTNKIRWYARYENETIMSRVETYHSREWIVLESAICEDLEYILTLYEKEKKT